jgi:hypothetical protein
MTALSGTLAQIALFMELYLGNPLGEEYWTSCDEAGDEMQDMVEAAFLATATNHRITQVSWQAIHISDNWAAFFSSAMMYAPLEGF